MAAIRQSDLLLRITGWLTWLDSIDAGPHPMDPLLAALKKIFAANAIADLATEAPQLDLQRRYKDLGRRLLAEAARDLQGAVSDDDTDSSKWHPIIPKWGGGPTFGTVSPSATKWLSHLPLDAAGSLGAAITTIQESVGHAPTPRK